jgi:small-conductance mechanosensitive channel
VNLIAKMMQGLAATGRHRAADRIPVLEAERDAIKAEQAKLDHADELITKVCQQKNALKFENARLTQQVETATEANTLLGADLDELSARLIETRQDLANALAVSSPAPADHGNPVPLPKDTGGKTITTLWDACGLRPVA